MPSIVFTTSMPSITRPKTTCLPSSLRGSKSSRCEQQTTSKKDRKIVTYQLVFTVVMKNWLPFELGPAFAIDRYPE